MSNSEKCLKRNIKYFKKQVSKAVDLFGLYSYQFTIISQDSTDARASNYYHSLEQRSRSDPRSYTIAYTVRWLEDEHTTKEDIKRTAYHEVLETMFSNLREYSNNIDYLVTSREVDSEIHKIVRTFENLILPLIEER